MARGSFLPTAISTLTDRAADGSPTRQSSRQRLMSASTPWSTAPPVLPIVQPSLTARGCLGVRMLPTMPASPVGPGYAVRPLFWTTPLSPGAPSSAEEPASANTRSSHQEFTPDPANPTRLGAWYCQFPKSKFDSRGACCIPSEPD